MGDALAPFRRMLDHVEEYASRVVIERWTDVDGWPVYRVFILAPTLGYDGTMYLEYADMMQALIAAKIMGAGELKIEVRGGAAGWEGGCNG